MENIHGEIEGRLITTNGDSLVAETGIDHFIVTSEIEVSEVFLSSSGLLSDGKLLDGIDTKIESERARIIRDRFSIGMASEPTINGVKGMILKAPMPGMVKTISVVVGDPVQKNTQVLVLEAMKMENSIMAGIAGVVSKIHVEAGISVEKNMPLAEFRKDG